MDVKDVAIGPKRKITHVTLATLGSQLREYGPRLHRFLMRRVRRRDLADDLVQQTYENVVRRFRTADSGEIDSMLAYLYTVAERIAYEQAKKEARENGLRDDETSIDTLATGGDVSYEVVSGNQEMEVRFQALEAPLRKFSAAQREMLQLKALGYDIEEIASRLGYAPGTVVRYLKLLRRACRQAWKGE